jgi:hypothetical protein
MDSFIYVYIYHIYSKNSTISMKYSVFTVLVWRREPPLLSTGGEFSLPQVHRSIKTLTLFTPSWINMVLLCCRNIELQLFWASFKNLYSKPFKTDVLFLQHSTLPIFHELKYCLICVKFPPKIAPRTVHTVRKNFKYLFKTVYSIKARTHLSHCDEKFYFLNLILYIFQITSPLFIVESYKDICLWEYTKIFMGKCKFEIFYL